MTEDYYIFECKFSLNTKLPIKTTNEYLYELPLNNDLFKVETVLNYQHYFQSSISIEDAIKNLKYNFFIKKILPPDTLTHDNKSINDLYYYDGITSPILIDRQEVLLDKLSVYFKDNIFKERINLQKINSFFKIQKKDDAFYDNIKNFYIKEYIKKYSKILKDKSFLKKVAYLSKEYIDFYIDFNVIDKFKIDNFDKNEIYFNYFYNNVLFKLENNIKKINEIEKIQFDENKYNTFLNEIQNSIISIIKVNNKNNNNEYNKYRYDYEIKGDNTKKNILNITYCDDTNKINNTFIPSTENRKKYTFGNFTHIFNYSEPNEEIVENPIFDKMIENLQKKKVLFIIGYGSSGSGKTSALIKFHGDTTTNPPKPAKNGVITELCNRIDNDKCSLKIKEFYNGKKDENHIIEKYSIFFFKKNNEYIFDRVVTGPKLKSNKIPIIHYSRLDDIIDFIKDKNIKLVNFENTEITNIADETDKSFFLLFEKGTLFADILTIVVDLDRFVKATTNNPQSSRSHTLIFLDFYRKVNISKRIIVGDFAGVENIFDCDDKYVINAFQDIKKYKTDERFYSKKNNSYNNKFDIIYNGEGDDGKEIKDDIDFTEIPKQIKDFLINAQTEDINHHYENFLNINTNLKNKYSIQRSIDEYSNNIIEKYNEITATEIFYLSKDEISTFINKTTNKNSNITALISKIKSLKINNNMKLSEKITSIETTQQNNRKPSLDNRKPSLDNTNPPKMDYTNQLNAIPDIIYLFKIYLSIKLNLCEFTFFSKIEDNFIKKSDCNKNFYRLFYENMYEKFIDMYEKLKISFLDTVFYKVNNSKNEINKLIILINTNINETTHIYDTPSNKKDNKPTSDTKYKPYYDICTKIIELFFTIQDKIFNNAEDTKESIQKYINLQKEITKENFDTTIKTLNIKDDIINEIRNVNKAWLPEQDNMIDYDTYNFFMNYNSTDIEKYTTYLQYIKYSCGLRRNEGIYINKELKTLRESIRLILIKKYPNYYNYIDTCFDQYIDINNNKEKQKGNINDYFIFKNVFLSSIYKHIYRDDLNIKNIQAFIDNIIICIFGIFNVTGNENNPPAVPYININGYVRLLNNEIVLDNEGLKEKLIEIQDKLTQYTSTTKMYTELIDKIEKYTVALSNNLGSKPKAILEDIISSIDNLNSTSVIGTLEFIDRTMKLYNTNILCEGKVEEVKQEVKQEVNKVNVIPVINNTQNAKSETKKTLPSRNIKNVKEIEIGSSFTFFKDTLINTYDYKNFKLQIISSSTIGQLNIIDIITMDIVKKRQIFIDQIQDQPTKKIFLDLDKEIEINEGDIINSGAQDGETLENVYIWDGHSIIGILIVSNSLYMKDNSQPINYNIKYLYASTNEMHKFLIGLYFICLKQYNDNNDNNTQENGFITLYGNYCNYNDYNLYNQLGFRYNPNFFRQYISNKTLLTHNLIMSVPIGNYAFNENNKIIDNKTALKYQTIKYYLYEYYNLYIDASKQNSWYYGNYFIEDIYNFIESGDDIINNYYKAKDNKEPKIFEAIDDYIKNLEQPK